MKVAKRLLIFLWLSFVAVSPSFAQFAQKKPDPGFANRWNLGINLGPDFYYGDLTSATTGTGRNLSMGGSLLIGWQISNVFGTRMQFLGAWLNGSADSLINGEVVVNPLTGILAEANLSATINFTNLFSPYRSSRWFFLYGSIGLGYAGWYTEFSNQAFDAGTISTVNPLNNFHAGMVIPVGFGAMFRLGDRVNASVEYTLHLVSSDLLDQTILGSNNDRFDYLAFGISLNLGKRNKRPTPVYYQPAPARSTPRILDPALPVATIPPEEAPRTAPLPPPPQVKSPEFRYGVQICAFAQHTYTPQWIRNRYRIPLEVRVERSGTMDRFIVGACEDLACAKRLREQMVSLGIMDAFIVSYRNGVRYQIVRP